ICISFYMRIDQVMLTELASATETGLFAAAIKINEAWYFIPMILTNSLYPAILNAKMTSEALYNNRLQKLFSLIFWISIAATLSLIMLSDFIVSLLLGPEFFVTISVLKVNAWVGVFYSLSFVSSRWYMTEGMQGYILPRSLM